jgi:hypothetical protein
MRVQHNGQRARPGALSANDEPRGDYLAGGQDTLGNGTHCNGLQGQYFHHVDSRARRRKTRAELIDSIELIEAYDRARPGELAGRPRR